VSEVEVKPTFVEPLALPDREHLQRVVVVRDDGHLGIDGRSVDGQIEAFPVAGEQEQRTELGERFGPATVTLAAVHEVGIEPQRHVVQEETFPDAPNVDSPFHALERGEGADRIVAIETQITRKVVPRAERDADEGQLAVEGHLGDRGERAVTAGDPQGICIDVTGELGGVVVRAEDPRVDAALARLLEEFLCARRAATRARVDQEQRSASS
jgi:hypothetical protein